jgi:hypothetical protein
MTGSKMAERLGNRERKVSFGANQDIELELFKREIDLRQVAVSLGYALDRRESWRGSTVLRRGGDKVVVKRNGNGHYVFFSVRDDGDHGTIIDFLATAREPEPRRGATDPPAMDRPAGYSIAVSQARANQLGPDARGNRVQSHVQRTTSSLSGE